MPLLVITGGPCSGKSTRAQALYDYFKEKSMPVQIITDNNLDRNTVYIDNTLEKQARSDLKAETQRLVTKTDLIILDALNYIKGYRYELYCITKLYQTVQCTIYCNTLVHLAREWNATTHKYDAPVFDALVQRYEPPEGRNRWDAPLFEVTPDDPLPLEQIADYLANKRPPPPNKSTVNLPMSDTNFLHDVDRVTQDVIDSIVQQSKMAVFGQQFSIPGTTEKITWNQTHSVSDLRRIRQQYLKFIKTHPPSKDNTNVTTMFVQFLNNNLC
ncbi:unnamed protein product [Rotaria magnacalcarata]|uniref:Protein KTI12 homolog n=3 Tax=Rotaria magnacalcarata TaxID=392030 RepID=A0A816MH59_9BILA|nr:unnamed protein product [Rotaria magnacalcarata]CAF1675801.1 unnamed protein product [Rotaria magnacalcarata]CAF1908989.1 unnamed protein product [Rotaria magnacalcarata]CAF1997637.1 unnamed protein product [Rotaria magnacalcarata]CAF2041029.1 unnamed protein product [Rotaria magnacalcarata]